MGTPDFAVPALKALANSEHEVCAVFTQPDKPRGRKMIMTPPDVKVCAEKLNIPVYQPETFKDGKPLEIINKYKKCIDVNLIKSAALLHDIKRLEKDHAKKGAKLLSDLGYKKISSFVKNHMELKAQMEDEINEVSILYFADKLVIEDQFTSIEKRFEEKLKKYDLDDVIKKNIRKRYNTTLKIKSNIISIIGEVEYEKLEEKWRAK